MFDPKKPFTTRDGRKVEIIYEGEFSRPTGSFINECYAGFVLSTDKGTRVLCSWDNEGKIFSEHFSQADLINTNTFDIYGRCRTTCGKKARLICSDRKLSSAPELTFIFLMEDGNGDEFTNSFNIFGTSSLNNYTLENY